jgi:phosphoribosyl-ATP pyrophosphohydrolase
VKVVLLERGMSEKRCGLFSFVFLALGVRVCIVMRIFHFSSSVSVLFCLQMMFLGVLPAVGDESAQDKSVEVAQQPQQQVQETYKVLSTHQTDAVFKGTVERPCRFKTAECPDRCNHGGVAAQFTITRYLSYKKPGKYGDPKTKEFSIMLKSPEMSKEMMERIKKLLDDKALMLSKIREEADEVCVAIDEESDEQVIYESADLLYHALVGLGYREISPDRVKQELARRFGMSGIEEKESRTK